MDGYLFPASGDQKDFDHLDKEMSAYIRAGLTDVKKVPRSSCICHCYCTAEASISASKREGSIGISRKAWASPSPLIHKVWCNMKVSLDGSPGVGGIKEALKFPGCGQFQPLTYLQGLAKAVEKHGGRIHENTRVMSTEKTEVRLQRYPGPHLAARPASYYVKQGRGFERSWHTHVHAPHKEE